MGPSDKIQIVDYPYALPSKCVICGGGPGNEDGRKYIDFNFQLDDYGAIYFCTFCVVNLAEVIGYTTPEAHFKVLEQLSVLERENETLKAENKEFRLVYSTLRGLGAVLPGPDDSPGMEHVSPEDNAGSLSRTIPKPRSKDKGTNKSRSVEGPGDVPESDSNTSDDGESDSDLSF